MSRLESILRNAIFSVIARGIDVGVTFILAVVLARYLGPEGMGEYAYIIAFVAVFVPLIDLGLDHILIREIAHNKESAKTYVGAALLLKIIILFVLFPLGMLSAWLFADASIGLLAIFLCFLGTMVLREIPTVVGYAVFLAYEKMEYRAVVTLLFQIVKFSATMVVVFTGGGLIEIFAAALLGELVQGLVTIIVVYKRFTLPRLVFDLKLWKYFVLESLPLGIAFAFNSLYFQIDILFLKHFRTAEETGIFGVPFRVVTTLFTLLIPMIWVLLPHLSRAAKESIEQLTEHGKGYLKGIAVITLGMSLYLVIESEDLVLSLFGEEYRYSAVILAMIAPIITLHAFTYFFDLTLTATGRQKLIIYGSGTVFLVKLIMDMIFIPRYGTTGAAWGTIVADVASFVVMFTLTRKYVTSFNLGKIMIRPLLAAGAGGISLWLLRGLPFYISGLLFSVAYLFFIWIFRVVSPGQQQVFVEMTRGLKKKFGLSKEVSGDSNDSVS
ncbi:flippase [bacterium]|nr:flippase [bacterium]